MYKYKENDIVKCTNITEENHEGLVVGEIYQVRGISQFDGDIIYTVLSQHDILHHSIDRFELVIEPIDVGRKAEPYDIVTKPIHYNRGKYETIDIIADVTRELSGIEAVCVANVIKYVSRYKYKNGIQDVMKAKWYIEKLIGRLEE